MHEHKDVYFADSETNVPLNYVSHYATATVPNKCP
jgi:hypothetical protein